MSAAVCPECEAGKHVNCTGWAIDPGTDAVVDCGCPDLGHPWNKRTEGARMSRIRKALGGLIVGALAATGVVAVAAPASAHTVTLSGESACNDAGTSWAVRVRVAITNTPYDHPAEVKAISTTAGALNRGDGLGVPAGAQVVLNAWPEHAVNWPTVPIRGGNWTDEYAIVSIPQDVEQVTTMVQVDWKHWHSADPTRTFYRPRGCTPADVCPNLPGNQSPGFECTPMKDTQFQAHSKAGTCKHPVRTTYWYKRQRTQVFDEQAGAWAWGPWSAWELHSVQTRPYRVDARCLRPKHTRVRVYVFDRCERWPDEVRMWGKHVTIKRSHPKRLKFVFRVTADFGYVLPSKIRGHKGWAKHQRYVVRTTSRACKSGS